MDTNIIKGIQPQFITWEFEISEAFTERTAAPPPV